MPPSLAGALTRGHLPSLDGLRAAAALAVVFYHFGLEWFPGGLGVLAFFVLSGFLITWLLLKEEERFGTVSFKLFYLRRSLRIFPAFYAYWLLLAGSLLMFHRRIFIGQVIASFFYMNNYYQALRGDPDTGFSHTWSLGIEEQFYLLWPVTFLLLGRNRRRMLFLMAGILMVAAYRAALVFVWHRDPGYIYEAFDTRADHLMTGCLLAVALREGSVAKLWRWLCSEPLLVWCTAGMLALSAALQFRFGTTYRDLIGFTVDPLLVATLIVQTLARPAVALGRVLNCGIMRYLGTISYSIYLYQQAIIRPVVKLAAPWPWLSLPLTVLAVIGAASASYWFIERPFLRLKKAFET